MSLVTGFSAMSVDLVESLRKFLEAKDFEAALQAASKITPVMGLEQTGLEEVGERSALVDRLIFEIPLDDVKLADKLLGALHNLIPSQTSITKSPGRNPAWVSKHVQWVGEVHKRRMDVLRGRFPVLYLQHMKQCDFGCGTVQIFQQIVSAQNPQNASEDFCRVGIDFLENRGSIERTHLVGWKPFVAGLQQMSPLHAFAKVYFSHSLKCAKKCGSWRVFEAIANREEPLAVGALRSAFRFLTKGQLRLAKSKNKQKNSSSQVKRCQGLQLLLPHASQLEPEGVRTRLLSSLFCQTAKHTLTRSIATPFLSYDKQPFAWLPTATDIGQEKLMCDAATLQKIVRHAEWRVKFMFKLLVALHKDGREYQWEKACLHYGRKEGNLVQCHSAIIPSLIYREKKGGEEFHCSQGYGFHSLKFFHELNHTVNLPKAYNDFDSWMESSVEIDGKKGLRNWTTPTLNRVSGFQQHSLGGALSPESGCFNFIQGLLKALELYLTGRERNSLVREYAQLQKKVYQQFLPIPFESGKQARQLNWKFWTHCIREDLGADYGADYEVGYWLGLYPDWQKKLLDE